jgi:murein tripeptide amidase MpaA
VSANQKTTPNFLSQTFYRVFDNEQPRRGRSLPLDWTRYWELNEIHSWLESLVAEYPADTSLIDVGASYEGRRILGLRLNVGGGSGKKQIIFEGTIHAREWISGATVTWMLNELLTSADEEVQQLAATYEWIIIPVLNVDGYAYTWSHDRFWRKTRRPTTNLLCYGADANRNWNNNFNGGGSSMNPCSDLYAGDFPFSEPETRQFSEFIANLTNLAGYFDFHAYGQLLMLPYGYTHELLENYDELYEIGVLALESLSEKFGTQYRIGSIANIICELPFTKKLNKLSLIG